MGAGAAAGGAFAADMPGRATPRVCFGAVGSEGCVGDGASCDQGEVLESSLTPMGAPLQRPTAGLAMGDSTDSLLGRGEDSTGAETGAGGEGDEKDRVGGEGAMEGRVAESAAR